MPVEEIKASSISSMESNGIESSITDNPIWGASSIIVSRITPGSTPKSSPVVINVFFLIKNIFSGYANFIEVRYLINLIPILEAICCLSIISFIERKKIKG